MTCFDFDLPADWNAISAVSNIIMAAVAFGALWYSVKQNRDLKKQWLEENRARLEFTIAISNKTYYLKVKNIGNRIAYDININIGETFINSMLNDYFKEYLQQVTKKVINIPAGSTRYYALANIEGVRTDKFTAEQISENTKKLKYIPVVITGNYNGNITISESFTMDQYTGTYLVNENPLLDELSNLNLSVEKISTELEDIKKYASVK